MSTGIHTAVQMLEHYKHSEAAEAFAAQHPFENNRRITYINNLVRQCHQYMDAPAMEMLQLICDDIKESLQYHFYHHEQNVNDAFSKLLNDVFDILHSFKNECQAMEKTRHKVSRALVEFPMLLKNKALQLNDLSNYK